MRSCKEFQQGVTWSDLQSSFGLQYGEHNILREQFRIDNHRSQRRELRLGDDGSNEILL